MDPAHSLAEFLRARRARIRPEDVGVTNGDRRRVPGLRREELAALAGVSADYYTRLEQGRDYHPSEKVLEALARALQLDADATNHLFALGRLASPVPRSRDHASETVRPEVEALIESWGTPAFIHGRFLDILASNAAARALTRVAQPGTNMLRSMFLVREEYERYEDLEFTLARTVAYFRAAVGSELDDPYPRSLIEELSLESDDFRRLWADHDVLSSVSGSDLYLHPAVGWMRLSFQTFAIGGTDRQILFATTAEPGSRDAEALARIAELARSAPG